MTGYKDNFSVLPVYSGKQMVRGDLVIFSANRSFLLRKRIIDVSVNHLLLQMESNSFILSIIRFYNTTTKQQMIPEVNGNIIPLNI